MDDAGYAGVIVRHYGAMGYGAARVRQELHRRGVPKELWDEALEQLPAAGGGHREIPGARSCGDARMTPEDSRRLAAALQRRGFAWQDDPPCAQRAGAGDRGDDEVAQT